MHACVCICSVVYNHIYTSEYRYYMCTQKQDSEYIEDHSFSSHLKSQIFCPISSLVLQTKGSWKPFPKFIKNHHYSGQTIYVLGFKELCAVFHSVSALWIFRIPFCFSIWTTKMSTKVKRASARTEISSAPFINMQDSQWFLIIICLKHVYTTPSSRHSAKHVHLSLCMGLYF